MAEGLEKFRFHPAKDNVSGLPHLNFSLFRESGFYVDDRAGRITVSDFWSGIPSFFWSCMDFLCKFLIWWWWTQNGRGAKIPGKPGSPADRLHAAESWSDPTGRKGLFSTSHNGSGYVPLQHSKTPKNKRHIMDIMRWRLLKTVVT